MYCSIAGVSLDLAGIVRLSVETGLDVADKIRDRGGYQKGTQRGEA